MLEAEGVVQQDERTKQWTLRDNNVTG